MAEERPADDVEKFLREEKAVKERRQALIDDLLRQRAEALKAFDEKLEKLGHKSSNSKQRRSHHKQPAAAAASSPKGKPKAQQPQSPERPPARPRPGA
jgi:hypothetical protein